MNLVPLNRKELQRTESAPTESKDSDYVSGSCGTLLCGVGNGVPQLPLTYPEFIDYSYLSISKAESLQRTWQYSSF